MCQGRAPTANCFIGRGALAVPALHRALTHVGAGTFTPLRADDIDAHRCT
jgi:hypothetical protein